MKTTLVLFIFLFACNSNSFINAKDIVDKKSITKTFTASEKFESEIQKSRELLYPLLEKYPSLSVSVGVNEQVVWSEGIGYANIEKKSLINKDSKYRLYSLSKFMTGIAIAKLAEEKKLNIDDRVMKYLPYLPKQYKDVRIKHLLSHTAAVRHYNDGEWMEMSRKKSNSLEEDLDRFINDPLTTELGEKFSYSSFAYSLLSAVIEAASSEKFESYLKSKVFKAENIFLDSENTDYGNMTFYTEAFLSGVTMSESIYNRSKWGGGAFVGTADNVTQLMLNLLNKRIISSTDQYFTAMNLNSGKTTNYAYGLYVADDIDAGGLYAAHSGGGLGGRAAIFVLQNEKIVVTLLANIESDRFLQTAIEIAKIFKK